MSFLSINNYLYSKLRSVSGKNYKVANESNTEEKRENKDFENSRTTTSPVTSRFALSSFFASKVIRKKSQTPKTNPLIYSDNEDINTLIKSIGLTNKYTIKGLEKEIKKQCNKDPEKIKDLSERLSSAKEVLNHLSLWFVMKLDRLDFNFIADYSSKIQEKFKDSDGYGIYCHDIYEAVNNKNKAIVDDLLSIKDIDLRTFYHTLNYCDSPKKAEEIKEKIKSIKNGKSNILELPYAKFAKQNEDILKLKNTQNRSFAKGTPIEEIQKETKQGEIVFVGNKTYINDQGQMTEIKVNADKFKELFPPYETKVMQQGNHTGNCIFLTHELIACDRNAFARPELYKSISQDGDDIIITFAKYPNLPVRFKNGEPDPSEDEWHLANTAKGNQIIEQAMYKAIYADINKLKDASKVSYDKARDNLPDRVSFNNFIAPDKGEYKHYKNEDMLPILEKYSDKKNARMCAFTYPRFDDDEYEEADQYNLVGGHAYFIQDVDKKNNRVTLTNPFNSLYTIDIDYRIFTRYFGSIRVAEMNK